jgi:drug/metabolite transporter (DMT)-like permease
VPPELLALVSAFCFASGSIAVKRATQTGAVMLGLLTGLVVNALVVAVVALATVETWAVATGPFVLFALSGLAGPAAARFLMMRSVRDVGASVAVPVQASVNPLLASAAGILLFGEVAGPGRLLAVTLVIGGIWLCVRGGSANRAGGPGRFGRRVAGLASLLPLSAGAAYAMSDILRKGALVQGEDPVLGALIGTVTALTVWMSVLVLVPRLREPVRVSPAFGWFLLNGVLLGVAQLALLAALSAGDLSVVSPIVASQPVIVVVLGALVLRDVEALRPGTVVGASLVFLGVVWLAAG